MAISGGAKSCVRMQVRDNELVVYPQGMAQGVVDTEAEAIDRLSRGEIVHVGVYGGLAGRVQAAVQRQLQEAQ